MSKSATPSGAPGGAGTIRRIGSRVLSVLVLAAIAALIVWMRPRIGMLISGGIWFAFNVYWAREVRRVAPVQRREAARESARHRLTREVGFLLLFIPIPGLTASILPGDETTTTAIGLAVQIAGAILYLRAKRELGAAWSSEVSIKVGHQLVRSGPYGWVRHPLYSAMLAMAAGTMIVCNQVHAAMGFVLMVVAYLIKLRVEDRWMREEFGAAWDEYCRGTSALIPFPK